MKLNNRQKRALFRLSAPLLILLYWGFRWVSLDAFRNRLARRTFGQNGKKILIVRLDTIGDVLLSEPAIRALKQAFPEARLDVLVGASGKAVLDGHPCIDRYFVYSAPWHTAWRGGKIRWRDEIRTALGVVRTLRRNRYDLAVELRGDPRDIALMTATGATRRAGNGWRGGGFMLDVDAGVDVNAHRVDFALGIARAAGGDGRLPEPGPKMWFGDAEKQIAESYLTENENVRFIAMHLGAGFPSKCLPVAKFADVGRSLLDISGREKRRIVLVGGKEDRILADEFQALLGTTALDLVGKVNLAETAAVFARCALFVGNDSGPMHIAAAVGTPVVTFFGPSEPHKYRPFGVDHRLIELPLPCRPCDHIHCSQTENICMTGITAADIVFAAEELLSSRQTVKKVGR